MITISRKIFYPNLSAMKDSSMIFALDKTQILVSLLTLLHSEQPKLHGILVVLNAKGLILSILYICSHVFCIDIHRQHQNS